MNHLATRLLAAAIGLTAMVESAAAQNGLTAVVLRGTAVRPGIAPPGTPTVLTPGVRIESPQNSWTEIAFSDGSSIVLEPGADFTLQSIGSGSGDGCHVIRASAGRGRLRITTSDCTEVALATPTAQVRVVSASAVVVAGAGGSATMLSGSRVVVLHNGQEDVLRRPDFAVVFNDGIVRETRTELAQSLDSFAPVTTGGAQNGTAEVQVALTTASRAQSPALALTGLTASQGTQTSTGNNTGGTTGGGTGGGVGGGGGTVGGGGGGGTSGGGAAIGGGGGGGTGTGGGGTGGGGTGGGSARTAVSASFSLASNVISGAGTGTGIAAPGSNSTTSSAAPTTLHAVPDPTDANQPPRTVGLTSTSFGSGRVRLLPPPNGFSNTVRVDTGRVTDVANPGQQIIMDKQYQNLQQTPLPQTATQIQTPPDPNQNGTITTEAAAGTRITVYDATARVGYLALDEATNNVSGKTSTQPNVWIGDGQTPSVTLIGPATKDLAVDPNKPACADPNACTIAYPAIARVPIVSGATDNGAVVLPQFSQTPIQLAGPDANHNGLMLYFGPQITLCPDGTCAQTTNNATQANTLVYIVDKVTAGIPSRGILENERIFAIGGTSVGNNLPAGLPQNGGPMQPGTVMRFAISDLLNPTTAGGLNTTQALPDQFNNPTGGVRPGAFTQYNAFRPEETFAAAAPRGDTHLWVVAGGNGRPNVASRGDLQILQDGRSSGSVSVAGITPEGGGGSLVLAGKTVGSTRTNTGQFSGAINANLGSLATGADGQSTHLLGGPDLNNGQISYFAVSQADPRIGTVNTAADPTSPPADIQPGAVVPVGADPTTNAATQFAYTRLATNVGPGTTTQPAGAVSLQGFASAVVEHSSPTQNTVHAYTTADLNALSIARNANGNTFGATFTLNPTSVGSIPSDASPVASPVTGAAPATLSFGDQAATGTSPQSAYVTNTTFAALGNTAQPGTRIAMTSVDGDLLKGIEGGAAAGLKPSNEHLAWGYFLGDLAMQADGKTIQDHVNLGFWVAGRPVGADIIQTLSGTSTYTGGLIGTAVNAPPGAPASIKTAIGGFTQQWDFGNRSGTINASFDGANWSGLRATMPTGNVFTGSGPAVSGDRTMSVQGAFFHNGALNGALPAAVGGHFGISNPTGTYGANGVMVGARSP